MSAAIQAETLKGLSGELYELELRAQVAEARARIAEATLRLIKARAEVRQLNNNGKQE